MAFKQHCPAPYRMLILVYSAEVITGNALKRALSKIFGFKSLTWLGQMPCILFPFLFLFYRFSGVLRNDSARLLHTTATNVVERSESVLIIKPVLKIPHIYELQYYCNALTPIFSMQSIAGMPFLRFLSTGLAKNCN